MTGGAGAPSAFSAPGFAAPLDDRAGAQPDGALSLASYRRIARWGPVPDGVVWSGCERRVIELRDALSGGIYWAGCGAWICAVCGPRRVLRLAEAIAWAEPRTFGRLSLMPSDWQRCRKQMYDLRGRLAAEFGPTEWAWVRHRNPKLTGHHVHFVARMPWVPQGELQAMTGGRIPWLSATKQSLGSADYLLGVRERKGASGYLLKRTAGPEFYLEHLALNGGRAAAWSRAYFTDPETGAVAGVKEALHAVKVRRGPSHWYFPGRPDPPDWRKGQVQGSRRVDVPRVQVHDDPGSVRLFDG